MNEIREFWPYPVYINNYIYVAATAHERVEAAATKLREFDSFSESLMRKIKRSLD